MSLNGKVSSPISQGGSGLPSRIIFHGVEGCGKTSSAAHAQKPVFSMTRNESGLLTLIDNGIIGPTDHFPEAFNWYDLLKNIRWLIDHDTGHRTYILDTINGAERLCAEHLCAEKFGGSWESFLAYGRGWDQMAQPWLDFLSMLDELRLLRRMAIVCLAHTKVTTFKNPEGDDYDRWTPDMNNRTWGLSHKWADVVLFGNHFTEAKKERGALKAKAKSSDARFLYTMRTAAFDAKNRVGLPPMISMGKDGKEAWGNLRSAMIEARKKATASTTAATTATSEESVESGATGATGTPEIEEVTSNG